MVDSAIENDAWPLPEGLGEVHLDRALKERFPTRSWNQLRAWIRGGNVFVDDARVMETTRRVAPGSLVEVCARPSQRKPGAMRTSGEAETARTTAESVRLAPGATGSQSKGARRSASSLLVHVDSQLVVAEKPPGISTVPYDETERDTLDRRVQKQLAQGGSRARLLIVHRIDKETSGLVVFARTQHALERLKSQFRFHTTERKYLALVHGQPRSRTISSMLVRDRGDGLRGSTDFKGQGRQATTHVKVLQQFERAALIECRLETGRTHQIRIHLAEAGHPLLGERVYSKGFAGRLLEAPRVMLHAATLGFSHPTDERPMRFESEWPGDFAARMDELSR